MSGADPWHGLPASARATGLDGDQIVLVSAGLDIGSSTMHLAVSRLLAERDGGGFEIVARELLYESPIVFTPYLDGDGSIDADAVAATFEAHYRAAGLEPSEVDTGVVILTGVALDRSNARALGERLGAWGGQFLSVTAGDRLEGVLAAHGSGAVAASRDGGEVYNVDVGGGTTKVARCLDGRVTHVQAFNVGARLLAWEPRTRILTRVEPTGRALARAVGIEAAIGQPWTVEDESRLTGAVATSLTEVLMGAERGLLVESLREPPFQSLTPGAAVVFSGGFSEHLGGRQEGGFGDLGSGLAEAVRHSLPPEILWIASAAGIRATAIGAGQFTVQVSGITIHRSHGVDLPLRSVPVVGLPDDLLTGDLTAASVAGSVRAGLAMYEGAVDGAVAIAIAWRGSASLTRLTLIAEGVAAGQRDRLDSTAPLLIVVDGDVARLLGRALQRELGHQAPLIVVDGILVDDLDFLDVGAPLGEHDAIPVTIKSLVFRDALFPAGAARNAECEARA